MEKFLATKIGDNFIELSSANQLEKLYDMLDKDENFILQWTEGSVLHSELKIATNISSKVKTGEVLLKSKEAVKNGGNEK